MDRASKYLRRDAATVKEDMRRTAAILWGAESVTPDQLDPVVDLLFGAFAQEIFAVQQDVLEHRRRMLEMSVQALLPQELSTARPAHVVLHGRPLDPNTYTHRTRTSLSTTHGMDVHDRVGRRFVFTPCDEFRLHIGSVNFLAQGDKFYQFDRRTGSRRVLAHSERGGPALQECWIGMELKEPVDPQRGLSLFFTLPPGDPNDWSLLLHLPVARFSIGGADLLSRPGIRPREVQEPAFDQITDPVKVCETEVRDYYQHKFVTLHPPPSSPEILNTPMPPPRALQERFGEEAMEEVGNDQVWIRMTFTTAVNTAAMEQLHCSMNCFPAINRERHERTEANAGLISLPMEEGEQFWAVDEVRNARGIPIRHERRAATGLEEDSVFYAIRRSGMERIDEREAYEQLMDLLHAVRNDHAAFASLNETELAEGLQKVKAWLEDYRSRQNRPPFPPLYILFNETVSGNVHVGYWTTSGSAVMRLPALKPFRLDMGTYLSDVRSMTVPLGAEDTPAAGSLGDRLRRVLTGGSAAMPTLHAARAYALEAIPGDLREAIQVSVAKEVVMGERSHDGLQSALIITLEPRDRANIEPGKLEMVREHVRNVLSARFQGLLPVHVRCKLAT